MTAEIRFLLNDRAVTATEPAGESVLDWLRRRAGLTGTKEGCKEGDCGACAVLLGELLEGAGDGGARVRYRPMTSCMMPLGELAGKHLVTVEGLNLPAGELTPVQQAIVDEGASQCGFCTPGIVVSMTGLMMAGRRFDREAVKAALSGHLCRCTGYRSLKVAGDIACRAVGERAGVAALVADGRLPAYFLEVPERLRELRAGAESGGGPLPDAEVLVAGGTDLFVQRGDELPRCSVDVLDRYPHMKGIEQQNGHLRVGALVTFEEFAEHAEVRRRIPEIARYMFLIASLQIRHRATLGGNVVNASPIGDMTVLLLALDAQLVLQNGDSHRVVPMRTFYRGYKVLDKQPGEVLTEIRIPEPEGETRVNWEKVSKRKCLDIASVNSAIQIRVQGGTIAGVRLAVGGVAPVPLALEHTREALLGRTIEPATVERALAAAQREIAPISDVRGSADYKRLLTHQLMIAHFTRLFPQAFAAEDLLGEPS